MGQKNAEISITSSDPYQKHLLRKPWKYLASFFPGPSIEKLLQILGRYEVLLVPVTSISKPGNTREYPGNCELET